MRKLCTRVSAIASHDPQTAAGTRRSCAFVLPQLPLLSPTPHALCPPARTITSHNLRPSESASHAPPPKQKHAFLFVDLCVSFLALPLLGGHLRHHLLLIQQNARANHVIQPAARHKGGKGEILSDSVIRTAAVLPIVRSDLLRSRAGSDLKEMVSL